MKTDGHHNGRRKNSHNSSDTDMELTSELEKLKVCEDWNTIKSAGAEDSGCCSKVDTKITLSRTMTK